MQRGPRGRPPASGFTLMEIMAVLAIMGIILLAVVPNIDGQVPAYRLRGGARAVASKVELCQSEAVSQRAQFVMAYDLDRNTYQILLPPDEEEGSEDAAAGEQGSEEAGADPAAGSPAKGARPANDLEHGLPPADPNAPADEEEPDEDANPDFSDRDSLGLKLLPDDIVFSLVVVGEEEHRSGKVFVPFSHLGNEGAHYVGLTIDSERSSGNAEELWVKFNPMTRTIEYSDQRPKIRTLPAEDGK